MFIAPTHRRNRGVNGVLVQDHATFGEPRSPYHPFRYGTTPHLAKIWEQQQRTGVGPVFLQDHDRPRALSQYLGPSAG